MNPAACQPTPQPRTRRDHSKYMIVAAPGDENCEKISPQNRRAQGQGDHCHAASERV